MFQPCVDANEIMKENKGRRIYVNITVLDASKAIKHKVAKKVNNTRLPNPIKQVVAKQASNVAGNRPSSANRVAEKLSIKLVEMIQKKMKEKGITITCKVVFLEGPYFVIQLQVIHCDAVVLAEARDDQSIGGGVGGDECGDTHSWGIIRWGMGVMGTGPSTKLESDILPNIIHHKLKSSLDEILKEKLTEQKVETKVATLPEHKQARYFFDQLEKIRDKDYPQNELNWIRSAPVVGAYHHDQHNQEQQKQHHNLSPKNNKRVQPSILSSNNTIVEKQPSPFKGDDYKDSAIRGGTEKEKESSSKPKSRLEEQLSNLTLKRQKDEKGSDDVVGADDSASKVTAATKVSNITATTSQIIRKVIRKK
mmetsp:Transcript_7721/g.11052  ORF Transcript_7721/g.11052 Transcript_7721/m.11052 type:complete len:365 (+) Transcript_7721:146-1240(+)